MESNPLDNYPSETVIDQITKYHSEMIKEPDFAMPSALYPDDHFSFMGKPEQFQDNLFDEYLHDANNFNKNNQPPFLPPQTPQIMHHPSLPPVLPFSDLSLSQSIQSTNTIHGLLSILIMVGHHCIRNSIKMANFYMEQINLHQKQHTEKLIVLCPEHHGDLLIYQQIICITTLLILQYITLPNFILFKTIKQQLTWLRINGQRHQVLA